MKYTIGMGQCTEYRYFTSAIFVDTFSQARPNNTSADTVIRTKFIRYHKKKMLCLVWMEPALHQNGPKRSHQRFGSICTILFIKQWETIIRIDEACAHCNKLNENCNSTKTLMFYVDRQTSVHVSVVNTRSQIKDLPLGFIFRTRG